MKKVLLTIPFTGTIAILLSFLSCIRYHKSQFDPLEFHSADEIAVHTWLHWMDKTIIRDGITKDLEVMNNQGIKLLSFKYRST
jgi:hypothetical protein